MNLHEEEDEELSPRIIRISSMNLTTTATAVTHSHLIFPCHLIE